MFRRLILGLLATTLMMAAQSTAQASGDGFKPLGFLIGTWDAKTQGYDRLWIVKSVLE